MSTIRDLRRILGGCRTIAVVGLSPQWHRPSFFAAKYMQEHGYRIVPVNPSASTILGEPCYPSVTAAAVLPTGQRQSIALREVREGEAIYYLGEVRISHGDELRFELEVVPEGGGRPLQVRFSQTFFID